MYLAQTFKFRYGEIPDLFLCFSFPKTGVRCAKENVLYFLYLEGKILGPYKTHSDCRETGLAIELYQLVHENKVLVIEPRQVAQQVISEKLYLHTATFEDMERNTLYYEYNNKKLYGPFMMETDIAMHDVNLLRKLENQVLFVISEKQTFER